MGTLARGNPTGRRLLLGSGGACLVLAALNVLFQNTSTALGLLVLGLVPLLILGLLPPTSTSRDEVSDTKADAIDQRSASYVSQLPRSQVAYCFGLGMLSLIGGSVGMWTVLTGRSSSPVAIFLASVGGLYLGVVCVAAVAKVWMIARRR